MEVITLPYPHKIKQADIAESIAAIGFFDGIHRGHQAVIQTAIDKAKAQNKQSAVITFYPHPSVVLNDAIDTVKYITPEKEKVTLLEAMGVDRVYIVDFTKEFSQLSPEAFVDHYIKALHVVHLVAGFDFSFGFKGAGNMENIVSYADGQFTTTKVDKITNNKEKISSTKIRQLLQEGDVKEVETMLGRLFTTIGTVVHGDKRGKKIGFPTANIEINPEKTMPKQGIYAVKVMVRGEMYDGMASLGVVPTFKDENAAPTLEVYIFDFDEEIYGEEMEVIWYEYMRDEVKFNGVDALIAQLESDEQIIRAYFN